MDRETEKTRRRYNRTALFYDWMDFLFGEKLRRRIISRARGKVLEVGVGTGINLPFYPQDCRVTGIDLSPGMLFRARRRVQRLRLYVRLLEMDVQEMAFPDGDFDTVVATCVFCSVPDPVKGLREVRRVCKTSGQVILLEHVRSENPLLGPLMDVFDPLFLTVIGSHINRRTVENVRKAGLTIREVQDLGLGILKLIVAEP